MFRGILAVNKPEKLDASLGRRCVTQELVCDIIEKLREVNFSIDGNSAAIFFADKGIPTTYESDYSDLCQKYKEEMQAWFENGKATLLKDVTKLVFAKRSYVVDSTLREVYDMIVDMLEGGLYKFAGDIKSKLYEVKIKHDRYNNEFNPYRGDLASNILSDNEMNFLMCACDPNGFVEDFYLNLLEIIARCTLPQGGKVDHEELHLTEVKYRVINSDVKYSPELANELKFDEATVIACADTGLAIASLVNNKTINRHLAKLAGIKYTFGATTHD